MGHDEGSPRVLVVDCDSCAGRPHACAECVVSVLLGVPDTPVVAASLLTSPSHRAAAGADGPSGHHAAEGPGWPDRAGALDDLDRAALTVLARAGLRPRVLSVRAHGSATAVGAAREATPA